MWEIWGSAGRSLGQLIGICHSRGGKVYVSVHRGEGNAGTPSVFFHLALDKKQTQVL